MINNPTTLLISVHTKYVQLMMDGIKTVELRKVKPRIKPGDFVLIYECAPKKRLSALFTVKNITSGSITELWREVQDSAGVSFEEFQNYYHKSSLGYGIWLEHIKTFSYKLTLEEVRKVWHDFRPPQSYYYLRGEDISLLENLIQDPIISSTVHSRQEVLFSA